MAVITGRYGSVQRLLPIEQSGGVVTRWSEFYGTHGGGNPDIRQGDFNAGNGWQGEFDNETDAAQLILNSYSDPDKDNIASTISGVTSWSLENSVNPIPYMASNTRGYQGKLEGVHSAQGTIAGIGAYPPIGPGQRFRFYGYVGPDNGQVDNYAGVVYRLTAIAQTVQIQINYQLTNPITWSVSWVSDWQQEGDELWANYGKENGTWGYLQDRLGFWDYTKLNCDNLLPSTTCNLAIEGVHRDVCLLDANIQFNTDVSQYVNSCSAKVGGWQSSVVGVTNCTLTANIHGDNYGDLYGSGAVAKYYGSDVNYDTDLSDSQKARQFWPGSNHAVRIYLANNSVTNCSPEDDSLAYWEFYKMFFGSFGGLNVDVTSNSPVQFSCNMEFNAFPGCEPGYIFYHPSGGPSVALVDLRPGSDGKSAVDPKDWGPEISSGTSGSGDSSSSGSDKW